MRKQIVNGEGTCKQLLQGAFKLAHVVGKTYGPQGHLVLLDRFAGLLSSRDGVTVAQEVVLDNPIENLGCSILKEACFKVNDRVGDGTTTTAILAAAILREGYKQIVGGVDPIHLCRALEDAKDAATTAIRGLSLECTDPNDLEQVALISCHDPEIAKIVSEGIMAAGEYGTIVVEDGQSVQTELVLKDGMEIDKGFYELALKKAEDAAVSDKVEGPVVAVVGQVLRTAEDVVSILEEASQQRPRPLLLFTLGLGEEAHRTLLYNTCLRSNPIPCHWIMAPGIGPEKLEVLKDIAALAGAYLIDPARGDDPHNFKMEYLGAFREAIVWPRKSRFIAYDDKIPFITARIEELKREINRTESLYKQDQIEKRIAKLAGGLCVIKVGAYTEAEMKEKRSRIEDALHATRAAMTGGVVPGGGVALLRAAQAISCMGSPGWVVLNRALQEPFIQLAVNAGLAGRLLINLIGTGGGWAGWAGWDFLANQKRRFEVRPRVADPTEVVVVALHCACSVASVLLNSDTALATRRG